GAPPAATVAAFVGTRTEPPTLPLLDALRGAGRRVLLPVLREDMDLEWAPFAGAAALRPARLGLLEPTGASSGLDAVGEAGLVLAPALAVDPDGRRIGQGRGVHQLRPRARRCARAGGRVRRGGARRADPRRGARPPGRRRAHARRRPPLVRRPLLAILQSPDRRRATR